MILDMDVWRKIRDYTLFKSCSYLSQTKTLWIFGWDQLFSSKFNESSFSLDGWIQGMYIGLIVADLTLFVPCMLFLQAKQTQKTKLNRGTDFDAVFPKRLLRPYAQTLLKFK